MSTTDLVHAAAAAEQFKAELANGTPDAKALQKAMEPNVDNCQYSETALDAEAVKTALATLKEKSTGSAYEYRFAGRFLLNSNESEPYLTAQEHAPKALLSTTNTTPGDLVKFNGFQLLSLENQGGATFTESSNSITITTSGQWRFIVNLGLAFYPVGKVGTNVRYWSRRPHTNTNFKQLPVTIWIIIKTSAGAVRFLEQIGETRFYREEINEDRVKRLSGAKNLYVAAGETVSFEIQRGGEFGTVVDNSTATTYKEVLGARKIPDNRIAGNPKEDLYNQITLVRIA